MKRTPREIYKGGGYICLTRRVTGETQTGTSGGRTCTSGRQLGTLAGALVVVSVLGAELGARVGEAAGPSGCAAEALGVQAGFFCGGEEVMRISAERRN